MGELDPDQPTRFFVVHMQKTAGTTLRDRLRATFPEAAIYPNRTDGPVGHSVISLSHLEQRWRSRRDELRVIAGHFPASTVELLDAEFVMLSVLRHPVARTLSYLRHQRALNRADRDRTLEEIYDDPFRFNGLVRNHMVRMFSIGADEMRAGDGVLTDVPDTADRLHRACDRVEALDAFGLQERFEEFWDDLVERYGFRESETERSNVSDPEPAPDHLVERIEDDNALDMELYGFAQGLYESRRGVPCVNP